MLKDKLQKDTNKIKDFSPSDSSLGTFQGCAVFCCFITDLYEFSYKVNKVNLHPLEGKQFSKDPPDDMHLSSSKNQVC